MDTTRPNTRRQGITLALVAVALLIVLSIPVIIGVANAADTGPCPEGATVLTDLRCFR